MQDYQPVDLSKLYNVGVDFLGPESSVGTDPKSVIGGQSFHGLPFEIGGEEANPQRCFIGFSRDAGLDSPVTVPFPPGARG
ncbi:MAG: hypothetical protein HY326_01055, partial [Chloroflexi bacterium]|nr:hypothetical protein [Chloroflexota bacterium]